MIDEMSRARNTWPKILQTAIDGAALVDFVTDDNFLMKVEELHRNILSAVAYTDAQPATAAAVALVNQLPSSFNAPVSREQMQLFEWMGRSTRIGESSRIAYCAALIQAGITSVKLLAQRVAADPHVLMSFGVTENDADDITLALHDLGFPVAPQRDFAAATTVENALFATKKALATPLDHAMASNTLICIARIASSSREAPVQMGRVRICESVVKLLQDHMTDAACVENGCCALRILADGYPDNNAILAGCDTCEVLPRALTRHLDNAAVVEQCCGAIGVVAADPKSRARFGITGVNEVVMRALPRHLQNEGNAEQGMFCISRLTYQNSENVWKLGQVGACEAVIICLRDYPTNVMAVTEGFRSLIHLCRDAENRAKLCGPGVAEAAAGALVSQLEDPAVAQLGCTAMHSMIGGNAYHKNRLGQGGACEAVVAALRRHHTHPGVALEGSIATILLATGSPENQKRFDGTKALLIAVAASPNFDENTKSQAREASMRVRS
jgi:hypothetical protein